MDSLKFRSAVNSLLQGTIMMGDVKEAYGLTVNEVHILQMHLRTIKTAYACMSDILKFADRRKKKVFFTYGEDINVPSDAAIEFAEYPYSFMQDLAYDYPEVFDGCSDNHDVTDLIISLGILSACNGVADPEMGCSYFYFKDGIDASLFIDHLNNYFVETLTK